MLTFITMRPLSIRIGIAISRNCMAFLAISISGSLLIRLPLYKSYHCTIIPSLHRSCGAETRFPIWQLSRNTDAFDQWWLRRIYSTVRKYTYRPSKKPGFPGGTAFQRTGQQTYRPATCTQRHTHTHTHTHTPSVSSSSATMHVLIRTWTVVEPSCPAWPLRQGTGTTDQLIASDSWTFDAFTNACRTKCSHCSLTSHHFLRHTGQW